MTQMEVGYFDSLSRDKGEVRGFLFGEPIFVCTEDARTVIWETILNHLLDHDRGPNAMLCSLFEGRLIGGLHYDHDLQHLVISGSWWQWGDKIVNISRIDFSNPEDHRIDEFERDNYERNWLYLVEAEDLYNLIQHGTGRASIREREPKETGK